MEEAIEGRVLGIVSFFFTNARVPFCLSFIRTSLTVLPFGTPEATTGSDFALTMDGFRIAGEAARPGDEGVDELSW